MEKDNIIKVFTQHMISDEEAKNMPEDEILCMVYQELSYKVSEVIYENINKFDFKMEKRKLKNFPFATQHTLSFNIVSDEELKRLQDIEYHFKLMGGKIIENPFYVKKTK